MREHSGVTPGDARESYPPWKARFDLVGGLWNYAVARRLSFYVTPLFIRQGFSATAVTILGWTVLLFGLLLLAVGRADQVYSVAGAALLVAWTVLDCVDGNVARYRGQCSRFGALLDSLATAVLQALLPCCVGFALYRAAIQPPRIADGLHFASWHWVAIGAVQSIAVLFRKGVTLRAELGVANQDWSSRKITLWTVLPRAVVGGQLPLLLLAALVRALDIFLLFYTVYSLATCIAVTALALHQARLADRQEPGPGRKR